MKYFDKLHKMKLKSILSVILLIQTLLLSTSGKNCKFYCDYAEVINETGEIVYDCFESDQDQLCRTDCTRCDGQLGIKCRASNTTTFLVCPDTRGGNQENFGGVLDVGVIAVIILFVILAAILLWGICFCMTTRDQR